jgi:hypothetical protein
VSSLFYILTNIVYNLVITLLIQLKLKIRIEFGVESTLLVHVYHNNVTQLHNVKHHKEHLHIKWTQNRRTVKQKQVLQKPEISPVTLLNM